MDLSTSSSSTKKAKTSSASSSAPASAATSTGAVVSPFASVSLFMIIVRHITVPRDMEHLLACVCKEAYQYLRKIRERRGEKEWKTPYSLYFSSFPTLSWAYKNMPYYSNTYIDDRFTVFDALGFCGRIELVKQLMLMVDGVEVSYSRAQYIMYAAARGGQLHVLQWLASDYRDFHVFARATLERALKAGRTEVAHWLWQRIGEFPDDIDMLRAAARIGFGDVESVYATARFYHRSDLCSLAAGGGHLELLKDMVAHGFPMGSDLICFALENDHMDVAVWAMENGCPRVSTPRALDVLLTQCISKNNNPDAALLVIRDLGAAPTYDHMRAALVRNLAFAQMLYDEGGPLHPCLFSQAVALRDAERLDWLLSVECPLDETAMRMAVKSNNMHMLDWMHRNSLLHGVTPCRVSAELGNLAMLQWLRKRDLPWDESVGAAVLSSCSLTTIKWCAEYKCPFGAGAYQFALDKECVEVLDYLKGINQPFTTENLSFKKLRTLWTSLLWLFDNKAFLEKHGVLSATSFLRTGGLLWVAAALASTEVDVIARYEQLKKRGVEMTEEGTAAAAARGKRDALDWHLRHGSPLGPMVAKTATGNLTRLKFLVDKGCPFDVKALIAAVRHNSLKVVAFLLEKGCPKDPSACVAAAELGGSGMKMLRLLWDAGFERTAETYTAALLSDNQHMSKMVYDEDCPSDEATAAAAVASKGCFQYIRKALKKKHAAVDGSARGKGKGKKAVKGNQASGGYGGDGVVDPNFDESAAAPMDTAADDAYFAELDEAFAMAAAALGDGSGSA